MPLLTKTVVTLAKQMLKLQKWKIFVSREQFSGDP